MNPDDSVAALVARNAQLTADNARLRLLLDQRDTPAELRHRLRTTLGLLREVIQRSAEAREEALDYATHLRDRLDALVRIHVAVDQNGEVDLHSVLAEELLIYTVQEGERLALRGPPIRLRPRAAQVLGVAFHELAVNAVEHGSAAMQAGGHIDVSWQVEPGTPDPVLVLVWKETSNPVRAVSSRQGFGTEVLRHMVAHDLNAKTDLAFEPDGLRWAIRCPFSPRIGVLTEEE
ncbi:MAG: sensor histidine kinase [Parafilimonas terrae]|nr:sensor histidine kinase [Parafilimonas terrae]